MEQAERKFDLEERLIAFATLCIKIIDKKNIDFVTDHLYRQLVRSATSTALNYGEVQGAESGKDFIHKMRLVLKELKECRVNLKIQIKSDLMADTNNANVVLKECEELIAIFAKSIQTAYNNLSKK